MKRFIVIPLCLIVFMLCTAESCKEKKANKVVTKLLGTWEINSLSVEKLPKLIPGTTDPNMIKSLRIDFDKYIANHGDLFWFATYGDNKQEQFEGRYEVSSNSDILAVTIYLDSMKINIVPALQTKTYFIFEAETNDISDKEFTINGKYEDGKEIILEGTKF